MALQGPEATMSEAGEPDVPPEPVVSLRGIRKSFGPVEVLHGVDFDLRPGEVHVLAGENGAGKSTLVRILSGVYDDFAGEMRVRGNERRFSNPSQARAAGVATIHQELSLIPSMSVADNLFLGRELRGAWGQVAFGAQEKEAERILAEVGLKISPRQPVGDLSVSQQQFLEIARALAGEASVVVFDEPTSALAESEVQVLFRRIRALRDGGKGIVYISHRMEEIYRLADRITVLRDGRRVGTAPARDLSPEALVRWMVGKSLEDSGKNEAGPPGEVLLEVESLRVSHPRIPGREVVSDVAFSLRSGEILGLAGLEGSGKSEVLHAIFGALGDRARGRVSLEGKPFSARTPGDSVARGMVLLTNDRKTLGLAPDQPITHSVSLASLRRFSNALGWMREGEERKTVDRMVSEFGLSAPSPAAPVRVLSGGNQQKVYLARCLMPQPRVLLLDEPTRGIDVGAKSDIHRLIRDWVQKGAGILLITSEMDELLTLSHRILVMHRGRPAAELDREEATKDRILAAAMGHGAPVVGIGGEDDENPNGGEGEWKRPQE